jgi:hypothetical protein
MYGFNLVQKFNLILMNTTILLTPNYYLAVTSLNVVYYNKIIGNTLNIFINNEALIFY